MVLSLRCLTDDGLGAAPAGENDLVLRSMARRAVAVASVFEETNVRIIVGTDGESDRLVGVKMLAEVVVFVRIAGVLDFAFAVLVGTVLFAQLVVPDAACTVDGNSLSAQCSAASQTRPPWIMLG